MKTSFALLVFTFALNTFAQETVQNSDKYIVQKNPLLNSIQTLSSRTNKWLKKWNGLNLENSDLYKLDEISGTTSVNVKIHKIDKEDPKGLKSVGSFVTMNESANPNSEIAYFNLAALLGVDSMYRPTVKYILGPNASAQFLTSLKNSTLKGETRNNNKNKIITTIEANHELYGCIKAKKDDSADELEEMIKSGWFHSNGTLKSNHPIAKFIQASKDQPKKGDKVTLKANYIGDAYELAREFSIMMTLDSVFGQYDRFSGGNIVIEKDENGNAHFFGSDNGGAEVTDSNAAIKQNLKLFNRFDKKVIDELRVILKFLNTPSIGYHGYDSAEQFVVDLGLYYRRSPKEYVNALKNNISLVLNAVHETEERYNEEAFFHE